MPASSTAAPRPLPAADTADLAAFRDALTARHAPVDAVEEHWVGEIAFALWQQRRLQALAVIALAAAESGTDEPDATRLPSLATLARYRARVERDLRLAEKGLEAARQTRPRLPSRLTAADAARMRWMAERIEAGLGEPSPANDTGEPEAQPRAESERHARAEPEPPPAAPGSRVARGGSTPGPAEGATVMRTPGPDASTLDTRPARRTGLSARVG